MTEKILVITGASRGIGLAAAELFQQHGYHVINLSRSQPPLDGVEHLAVDLSEPGGCATIADVLLDKLSKATQVCLLHNAALLHKDGSFCVDAAKFQQVLQVNVVAASQLNQLLLPVMPRGSSIIYVGSTLAEKAVANSLSYVTSKHAQLGMMRANCQDLAGKGIHTVCVCPGFTATEMLSEHIGDDPQVLNSISSGVSFQRLIQPCEIAQTLFFAATHPVLNGALVHANLGQIER